MAYKVNLSSNQQLMIENRGNQTIVNLFSSSLGQQQSQSSSFTTGIWTDSPKLYQTSSGFILQLYGELAQQNILIQANSLNAIANLPLNNAMAINLEKISDQSEQIVTSQANFQEIKFEPMQPIQPMQPMQPMQMGNMSMSMNPTMSMQMGNMSMNMGETAKESSTKRFCSQCGEKIKPSDRFCSSCGHKLDD